MLYIESLYFIFIFLVLDFKNVVRCLYFLGCALKRNLAIYKIDCHWNVH